ncbi:class II aldolase/adducin family protein [Microscilla marina]|uniref:Class II aldolase/adducin, N-terminal n=1 Tax=Microscilla marina ATCC 23134 TaxID=313606 RepID=A1ZLV6_MICM2|nr:class II aldolase/adducin family protein [Microscilla marina]EAY28488.1 class II aldolase/adducin, N-terminal [Microscilla marina ATCC 23134]
MTNKALTKDQSKITDNVPRPPQYDTPQKQRNYLKRQLAAAFRLFAKFGFDEGVAGHITARDPEYTNHFWVNPFGLDFSLIKVSDLVLCNDKGEVVEGKHPMINRAAFAIHSCIHKARPKVIAAAHTHSMYGKAWSTLGRKLSPITQDACAFYQDHELFDDYNGVVNELEEGTRIAQALGQYKAVILQNHGLLTVGNTVEAAAWWFITMERSCQAQLLAESVGKPVMISHEVASKTQAELGSPLAGWFQFQPLWQRITKEQPDLLD